MYTRSIYTSVYILLFLICGAAYGQPTLVAPIASGSKNFVHLNGSLYFSNAGDMYQATGTSAPTLVKSTGENILRIPDLAIGNNIYFITQGGAGERLWRSDGTAANTVQITTATQIIPLLTHNNVLYMQVNASGTTGVELWRVDGTSASLVKDINPGTGNGFAGGLTLYNNLLYFFGNNGTETDLWRTDGTNAGTVISADLENADENVFPVYKQLMRVDNAMFFSSNYESADGYNRVVELWKTDGTAGGTTMVVQYIGDYYNHYVSDLIAFQGKLYFFHSMGDPAYVYFSVSDGTPAGTQHIDRVAIDGEPIMLIDAGAYLLQYSHSQGYTNPIEKYDGTTMSTVHQFSDYHGGEEVDLTYTEGRAFFLDYAAEYDYPQSSYQLFQADLASGVTRPVQEIYPGTSFYNSSNITAADGSIFFTRVVSNQMSLWYYDPSESQTCQATGNILQEIWTNVTGSDVRAFDFSSAPTGGTRSFTSFETTQYYANNYASRMRGTICVPQSGLYTFWISSDDQSELYLSTNAGEERKQLIAWVYGHTPFRNYDKYPSQKSAQVYLQANHKYYIEARHKESNGNDFISVGWQLPDGTMQRPIPGDRLSPVTLPPNQPPVVNITSPQANQSFTTPATVTIAADVTDADGVSHVRFDYVSSDGYTEELAYDYAAPYQYQWNNLPPGDYQVLVTAIDSRGAESSQSVSFTVQEVSCAGRGTIVREIWRNISGTSVSSIPVNTTPDNTVTLTSLSTTNYYANNYGSRIHGHICAPESGTYMFWISGDDNSELWLSSDDDPANKTRIAYVTGSTHVNEWTRYSSQQSNLITLAQGHRYYIEVLQKEANGADHVEVGWRLPSNIVERPMQGQHLIPFEDSSISAAQFAAAEIFNADEETTFAVYPNPAVSGRQVSLRIPIAVDGDIDINITSITGISVQYETLSGADGKVLIDLKPTIPTGMYLIRAHNQEGRWATKLQVK